MSIDLIALDLDGTLLGHDDSVSARNKAAITACLAEGIRVVLVTGRGVDTPIRISRELNLNLPVICAHGALTKDFQANRTLLHIPVPLQYAKPMIEFAEAAGLSIAVYIEETFWRLEGEHIYMKDMTGPTWREAPSLAEILTEAPTFIRFLGAESVDVMKKQFGDLPLNFRYEHWLDFHECAVLSREAGKQPALARLCADFGITRDRVLAIGDSRNDVPMLQWAGIGIAMANALPEVKDQVRYVTASHDRDGVALALEKFVISRKNKTA